MKSSSAWRSQDQKRFYIPKKKMTSVNAYASADFIASLRDIGVRGAAFFRVSNPYI
jgi:hypothetical protein